MDSHSPAPSPFPAGGMQFIPTIGGIGKARCEPDWSWRPPPLEDYDLWYALSGQGVMRINGEAYPVRKGSCFLIRPGDVPEADQDPNDRLRVIFVHFDIGPAPSPEAGSQTKSGIGTKAGYVLDSGSRSGAGEAIPLSGLLPARHVWIQETYSLETILERVVETTQQCEEWHLDEFELLMKQVFLRLYREGLELERRMEPERNTLRKQQRLVRRITAYIQDSPSFRVTHAELAAEAGLSAEYLNRLFKKHTGYSLKETVTRIRLERALTLLQETTMNVSQVADSLGYASVYLFSRQFKDHFGEPPSEVRGSGARTRAHGKKEGRKEPRTGEQENS